MKPGVAATREVAPRRAVRKAAIVASSVALLFAAASCKRTDESASAGRAVDPPASAGAIVLRPTPPPSDVAAPKPGMAWIPAGTFRAGTPVDRVPRIADEEPAGVSTAMGGFYIDLLPYPNETGAIPTSNVSREEAEQLCTSKGKRLCTELEWERACKGPKDTAYEYGDGYRAATCGTGVTAEEAARRPSGEHSACRSGFGASDMHGGVWEWTDSTWGRGSKDARLGVLRGGNSVAGELVGRCSNAIARLPQAKAPTMGFRCCSGARNDAKVELTVEGTTGVWLVPRAEDLHETWEPVLRPAIGTQANHFSRAWRWTPTPNEKLLLIFACNTTGAPTCSLAVGREHDGRPMIVTTAEAGHGAARPDMARLGDARHLRLRGLDPSGTFGRDVTYVYGRVEIGSVSRP